VKARAPHPPPPPRLPLLVKAHAGSTAEGRRGGLGDARAPPHPPFTAQSLTSSFSPLTACRNLWSALSRKEGRGEGGARAPPATPADLVHIINNPSPSRYTVVDGEPSAGRWWQVGGERAPPLHPTQKPREGSLRRLASCGVGWRLARATTCHPCRLGSHHQQPVAKSLHGC
jgi:hypothetical protein